MAITTARDNEKFEKRPKVGASGAGAPEGYGFMTVGQSVTGGFGITQEEDVIKDGKEGSEKKFAEAKKFMDSLKKAEEVDPAEVKEEQDKEALKKPTAPGADVNMVESGKGQPAKATIKQEEAQVLGQDAAKKQAEGDVKGGEEAKKAAEAAKKEAAKAK